MAAQPPGAGARASVASERTGQQQRPATERSEGECGNWAARATNGSEDLSLDEAQPRQAAQAAGAAFSRQPTSASVMTAGDGGGYPTASSACWKTASAAA
ncbi:MAG TPA: hypothetical protein VH599_10010 [Ktedonobacterales bacterium]